MDTYINNIPCSKNVSDYLDSIKDYCSCRVSFPESINYNIHKLLGFKNKVIGMFKIKDQTEHYVQSCHKLLLYCTKEHNQSITLKITCPSGVKYTYINKYYLVEIKCNNDYKVKCLYNNTFEIIVIGLEK